MEACRQHLAVSDVCHCRQFVADSCHLAGPRPPGRPQCQASRIDDVIFRQENRWRGSRSVLGRRTTDLAFRRFMSADGRWLPPMPARYTAGQAPRTGRARAGPGFSDCAGPSRAAAVKYGLSIPAGRPRRVVRTWPVDAADRAADRMNKNAPADGWVGLVVQRSAACGRPSAGPKTGPTVRPTDANTQTCMRNRDRDDAGPRPPTTTRLGSRHVELTTTARRDICRSSVGLDRLRPPRPSDLQRRQDQLHVLRQVMEAGALMAL